MSIHQIIKMNKRIIVALDSNNIDKTKNLVIKLKNEVFAFKIRNLKVDSKLNLDVAKY